MPPKFWTQMKVVEAYRSTPFTLVLHSICNVTFIFYIKIYLSYVAQQVQMHTQPATYQTPDLSPVSTWQFQLVL